MQSKAKTVDEYPAEIPADRPSALSTLNITMKITEGGLDVPRVQTLLAHHFETARAETARGSAHALDLSGLRSPDVHFWSVWEGGCVIAIGALKRLSESHGEINLCTPRSH